MQSCTKKKTITNNENYTILLYFSQYSSTIKTQNMLSIYYNEFKSVRQLKKGIRIIVKTWVRVSIL